MSRSRLAPSPTGAQHVGNARTYLIAWLAARAAGHTVVLRIEDIDSPRVKAGAAELLETDLRWLGLDWDEGPSIQTHRLPLYQAALQTLRDRELVYPCTCTRSDVANSASAPHAGQEGPMYPGTCRGRSAHDAEDLEKQGFFYCWRYRFANDEPFTDGFQGRVDTTAMGGDFVVWKAAGTPAYQLAVVVDDADMAITHVVRGDDLIPSTPRQMAILKALGKPAPQYFHVPLVIGPDGRRLAKRHGDTRLVTLRDTGIPAEKLLGVLAWSCGWLEAPTPITAEALIPRFRWDTIPPMPFVWQDSYLQ